MTVRYELEQMIACAELSVKKNSKVIALPNSHRCEQMLRILKFHHRHWEEFEDRAYGELLEMEKSK